MTVLGLDRCVRKRFLLLPDFSGLNFSSARAFRLPQNRKSFLDYALSLLHTRAHARTTMYSVSHKKMRTSARECGKNSEGDEVSQKRWSESWWKVIS